MSNTVPSSNVSFEELGLHPDLIRATKAMGFTHPTPIQAQAVPMALSGSDVLGCAQTGGGKTAAFVLPMLHHFLSKPRPGLRGLILVPTRELAVQVDRVVKDCGRFAHTKTAVVIGGVGHGGQTQAVRQGAQVVVATPGRLLDHLEQRNFNLAKVDYLVLDEADRMLDMGFLPDIRAILNQVPRERQTHLFSATLAPEVQRVAAFALKPQPARVEIERQGTVAEGISQILYPVIQSQKASLLLQLLQTTEMKSVLVFSRTKHGADKIASRLQESGYKTGVLHANKSQNQRMAAMDDFRTGRTRVLVATDIAARGIDVKDISHVVNFDVPRFAEDYVHRVGRTARAYGVGDAMLLVDPSEESFVRDIERFTGIVFPRAILPGFQYNKPPRFTPEPSRGYRGPTGPAAYKHNRGQNRGGAHRGGNRGDSRGGSHGGNSRGGNNRGFNR